MANEKKILSPYATFRYSLTFKNSIAAPADDLEELTLVQGEDVMLTENKNVYLLTLKSVKMSKKIYQPVEIEAELDFMQRTTLLSESTENTAPTFKAVSALLMQRQAELKVIPSDATDALTVAKNCYVYELKPQLKVDVNGTWMKVKLNIFSMDKLMTLNKYSKAYVARKLGSGILKPESLEFGKKADDSSPIIDTDTTALTHLLYKNKYDGNKESERIQPYLVQYNESFHDFLVRTSNRCGEFLYFEDGALTLGLPQSKDLAVIQKFESVVIQEVADDPMVIEDYVRDSMKDGSKVAALNHTVIEKLDNGYPEDAFPDQLSRNAELSNDEYNFPLASDKFTSMKREALYDKPINKSMNGLKALTMGDALAESVIGFGVAEGLLAIGSNSQVGNTNKAMSEHNIKPYKEKKEQSIVESSKSTVTQFATMDPAGWIDNKFYHDIRQYETELGREIICIDMGTAFMPVKLGQKIKVTGLEDNYIVIEIRATSEESAADNTNQRQQSIYAIPSVMIDSEEKFFPPVQPVSVICKSGPQTAFVTDNNDPKYQGRVRVAFPWQSLKKGAKQQLQQSSQSLKKTKEQKLKLKSGMRQMKLKVWGTIERLYELIDYVKASPAERVQLLAAKKAEIEALEREIYQLMRDKTKEEKSDTNAETKHLRIQELDSEIKKKLEKLEPQKELLEEMEPAAKEHDKKKSIDGYVLEKDNTVVKAKWDNCEKLYYDEYEASHEKIKDLEKEEKAQESQKKSAEKVVEKTLLENSTPWIRVASPMATPGGGTYFKPRVGDEVLINFDNDNVERPYVVGSLYSKNNLDPAESFERKGAPDIQFGTEKKVSMSLMSPNGHHITFSDPKDGNKFVLGLNPGTKFLGPMLPIPSIPNSKELAGGIHIGDRYGIYEIDMSSDNRSINIKSPLGTVDINAFTGITINAPNGDVNIRGKNVNISAGNKVTITSGNNIQPPGIGSPDFRCGTPVWQQMKGWRGVGTFFANLGRGIRYVSLLLGHTIVSEIPSGAMDVTVANFADLSLLRHVFEVAVKPVDGTLLIKSKRYLKLEAGPGVAKIKADRFNGEQKIDSLEKFYMNMVEVMKDFNNRITAFFTTYKTLWEDANNAKEIYAEYSEAFLKEPDVDKVTKDAFQAGLEWDEETKESFKSRKYETDSLKDCLTEFRGTYYGIDEQKEFLAYHALQYAETVVNLHAHVMTLPNLLKGYSADNIFQDAANLAFGDYVTKEMKKWKDMYGDSDPTTDFVEWPEKLFTIGDNQTLFKRRIAATYLVYLSRKQENVEGKFLHLGFDETDIVDKKIKSDYNWKNFMTHFDQPGTHGNKAMIYLLEGFWAPIKKRFTNPIGVKKENEIWSDKDGQILFSDNDGATLHIEGEGLKSETQSNIGNRDQLLKLLLSIK